MIGTKILETKKSKYNGNLRVVKTLGMGVYIQSEGLTQSGGIVETIWKHTLRKIPNSKIRDPKCLILGLGGGTVAKLVRKKWPNAKITGVEIDPLMIEFGRKYLNLDMYGLEIKLYDAFEFLKTSRSKTEQYDLIIIDLYNGDQFPKQFKTENYIQLARTVLASGGMAIFNRLYYGDKRPDAVKFGYKLKKMFNSVEWFYPEANLMFLCSK